MWTWAWIAGSEWANQPEMRWAVLGTVVICWGIAFRVLIKPLADPAWVDLEFENLGKDGVKWLDLYSTRDLVPHGPLFASTPHGNGAKVPRYHQDAVRSIEVQNGASPRLDHTAYFANNEQVIARIVNVLRESGKSNSLIPQTDIERGSLLREHRLSTLGIERVGSAAAGAAVMWALRGVWADVGRAVGNALVSAVDLLLPSLAEALRGMESAAGHGASVVGFLVIVSAMVLSRHLVQVQFWRAWDGAATSRWFAQGGDSHIERSKRRLFAWSGTISPVIAIISMFWLGHSTALWGVIGLSSFFSLLLLAETSDNDPVIEPKKGTSTSAPIHAG